MALPRNREVTLLSSATVYHGPVFEIVRERVRLPSGLEQDLAIVDHPGAIAIAAQDDNGELILVRQYRHAAGDWLTEIPAGRLEAGEQRIDAARRELEEETGYQAGAWSVLIEFLAAPGFCSERMTIYLARGLRLAPHGARAHDPDEEFELVRMRPEEVLRAAIPDAKTLIAALLLRDPA